jgi:hypothetical protein
LLILCGKKSKYPLLIDSLILLDSTPDINQTSSMIKDSEIK